MLAGSDRIGSIVGDGGAMFEDDELRRVLSELAGNDGEVVIQELMKRALSGAIGRFPTTSTSWR